MWTACVNHRQLLFIKILNWGYRLRTYKRRQHQCFWIFKYEFKNLGVVVWSWIIYSLSPSCDIQVVSPSFNGLKAQFATHFHMCFYLQLQHLKEFGAETNQKHDQRSRTCRQSSQDFNVSLSSLKQINPTGCSTSIHLYISKVIQQAFQFHRCHMISATPCLWHSALWSVQEDHVK